jgi:hypothetical protein
MLGDVDGTAPLEVGDLVEVRGNHSSKHLEAQAGATKKEETHQSAWQPGVICEIARGSTGCHVEIDYECAALGKVYLLCLIWTRGVAGCRITAKVYLTHDTSSSRHP